MFKSIILVSLSLSLSLFNLGFPLAAQSNPIQVALKIPQTDAKFQALVDRYFDNYFRDNPTTATYLGVHDFDHQLEDYSLQGLESGIQSDRSYLKAFEDISPQMLSEREKGDRELLIHHLKGKLLEAENIRNWEKNPDVYSSGISYSIFTLMARNFAPADQRLKAVIARERQIPAVLAAAKINLKNPPKVFTEVALEQLPGTISFFENDVPTAFAEVRAQNPQLWAAFQASNQIVIQALKAYETWMKEKLLPLSKGDYRLGEKTYRLKLQYDEMVDLPLDELLKIGMADLRKNQARFQAVGKQLDPQRSPAEILADLGRDHPPPDQLIQNFRDVLGGLRDFIQSHQIITLPSQVLPQVTETPPFQRAVISASMDTPGPFETQVTEAFFNVTPPEKDWSAGDIADYMAGFNYGTIISTAIHEAYPGHYIQFLWAQKAPSKTRQILGASSNFEGWAHYCEQMMLEAGYGKGDLKLELGQLQDALLRNARYIVGIQLHTGKMSFEEGVEFFIKEGYQSRTNALRETLRGTGDPTYLYYTLGKLQILKLRADYKALKGEQFSLREFHDRFMQEGFPPIKIVRQALLGEVGELL